MLAAEAVFEKTSESGSTANISTANFFMYPPSNLCLYVNYIANAAQSFIIYFIHMGERAVVEKTIT